MAGGCSGRGRAVPTTTPGLRLGGRGGLGFRSPRRFRRPDITHVKLLPLREVFRS